MGVENMNLMGNLISVGLSQKLSEFANLLIPQEATIVFIEIKDFDGDGKEEAEIGYSLYNEFNPTCVNVLFMKITKGNHKQAIYSLREC